MLYLDHSWALWVTILIPQGKKNWGQVTVGGYDAIETYIICMFDPRSALCESGKET